MAKRKHIGTHQFAFIVCLIILCDAGNHDIGTVVVDRGVWFEEDKGVGWGCATRFFDFCFAISELVPRNHTTESNPPDRLENDKMTK